MCCRDAAEPVPARFTVRVSGARSATRRFVIRSSGPLAAAIEAFARCSETWPEVVDVRPLKAVGSAARPLHVTFESSDGEQFDVRVQEVPD
jgi:hypothetical protein